MEKFKSFIDRPKRDDVEVNSSDELFVVSGWVASGKVISQIIVCINDRMIDAKTRRRVDVETLHGSKDTYVIGYMGQVDKSDFFIHGENKIEISFFDEEQSIIGNDFRIVTYNREPTALVKPSFLGIGAQKGGTTWLYENLRVNRSVYFPKKEMQFFNRRTEIDKGMAYYYGKFKAESSILNGEITPEYSFLGLDQIRFIKEQLPDVKIVYILRNPIERSWSGHMMHSLHSLKKNYRDMTKDELLLPLINKCSGVYMMSDYYTNLKNWLSVYPEESILIEFNDNIKSEPEQLLKRVMNHINLPSPDSFDEYPIKKIIQPTFAKFYDPNILKPEIPIEFIEALREAYIPVIKKLRTLVDSDIIDSWLEWGLE